MLRKIHATSPHPHKSKAKQDKILQQHAKCPIHVWEHGGDGRVHNLSLLFNRGITRGKERGQENVSQWEHMRPSLELCVQLKTSFKKRRIIHSVTLTSISQLNLSPAAEEV